MTSIHFHLTGSFASAQIKATKAREDSSEQTAASNSESDIKRKRKRATTVPDRLKDNGHVSAEGSESDEIEWSPSTKKTIGLPVGLQENTIRVEMYEEAGIDNATEGGHTNFELNLADYISGDVASISCSESKSARNEDMCEEQGGIHEEELDEDGK
jgi:hypothetical protein